MNTDYAYTFVKKTSNIGAAINLRDQYASITEQYDTESLFYEVPEDREDFIKWAAYLFIIEAEGCSTLFITFPEPAPIDWSEHCVEFDDDLNLTTK